MAEASAAHDNVFYCGENRNAGLGKLQMKKHMSKNLRIIFLLVVSFPIMQMGCGRPVPVPVQDSIPSLVWPLPPERPRIQYLYSISGPEDIGVTHTFAERMGIFFAGPKPPQQMVRPYGMYSSPGGVLYVTDPGSQAVHVFDVKNRRHSQIKKYGKMNLVSPIGVTMDGSGFLYVSDSVLRKIFVFGPKGEPIREIGGEDWFSRPTGIAIHLSFGRLYIADAIGHSIHAFDLKGNFLFRFGERGDGKGEFNFPTSLAIDQNGNLYVNDSLNFRIQIFEADGKFLRGFGKQGDGIGEFSSPKGVALDTEGNVYVADAIFDAVQIFSKKGELLLNFGEAGQGPGEFWIPASIFIDQANRIFVSDSYNQRIQVFKFLGGSG